MVKWKVNKERINTDIPDENGNVVGGAVTYPTKRLIVDAKKNVAHESFSEETYVRENVEANQRENGNVSESVTEKVSVQECDDIVGYSGISMTHGIVRPVNEWISGYGAVDDEYNVGLNVKGYDGPNYNVPHINFGIDDFLRRKYTSHTYGSTKNDKECHYDVQAFIDYFKSQPSSNTYINNVTHCCYPLYVGDEKYNIYNVSGNDSNTLSDPVNKVEVDIKANRVIMTFKIKENAKYKLGSWHFHTKDNSGYPLHRLKKTEDAGSYQIGDSIGKTYYVHVLFFEYQNEITYFDGGTTKKQRLWTRDNANANNTPVILVRRLRRDSNGNVIKGEDGSPRWKLCAHAKTDVFHKLKTWDLRGGDVYFFENTILKNVDEYDYDELDKLCNSEKYNLYVDNVFYAEEIDVETEGEITGADKSNYQLTTKDVVTEREYRTYDLVNKEEWKKTMRNVVNCVDDTTCKLFKGYTQQILPSTTIVKAHRCEVDESGTIDRDEWVRDLEPEYINYSDWQTEIIGTAKDVFVKAKFNVYFDDLEGSTIDTQEYVINTASEYKQFVDKTITARPVSGYPLVNGETPAYWYMASNKALVEGGVDLPDNYKFGGGYNSADIVKHTGVHFLPYMFNAVTYTLRFYGTDGGLLSTRTEIIRNKSDYEKIVAGTKTSIQTLPTVNNLEYWVKEDKRTVDPSQHTANDKYGTSTTQSIDLYKNNGVKFYPVTYEAVTYNVYFHSPKGTVMKGESKTISTLDDFNKFIKGELASQYVEVPTTISIDGYDDNPIGFWVKEDKWDKAKLAIKSDEVGNEDKYGDGENMTRVDMSNYLMFGDKKELHFYPFVGVNDINHIVISFNMNPIVGTQNKDLDNLTEIYNADTGEKLLGPIGWASVFVNPYSTQPSRVGTYQYGYNVNSDDVVSYNANSTNPSFFGHSGDNQGEGYEGIYVYVNPIDKVQYDDEINMKKLCSKALSEVYPEVQLFKIKIYGEWYAQGDAVLGSKANIKVNAYKGGYPIRTKQSFYDIGAMKLKNGESEELKTYFYGNTNIAIWSRSRLFDGGFGPNSENEINNSKYDKIYDYMGYILYNPLLKSAQYVEPIIVGKRSGEYLPINTINFPETTKFVDGANVNSWADLPFYADPDEYDISLEMKNGYTEAQRLDGTTIYVKKKLV